MINLLAELQPGSELGTFGLTDVLETGVTFRFLNRLLTREGTGISGLSS